MVIAINTKYFLKAYQHSYTKFIYECFSRIGNQQPQHTFLFISYTAFDTSFAFPMNCIPVVIRPAFNATMLSRISYTLKIPAVLKKYKANVFLHADGYCSLFINIPQCLIVPQPAYLSGKYFIKKNHLFIYQKLMPFFLKRASAIVAESQFSKNFIIRHFKTDEQKIDVIPNGLIPVPGTITWEEKEKIKTSHADGNEYFIFLGDTSQQNILLNLLKGFSNFKRWQKSSMQLFIVINDVLDHGFAGNLSLFKYRGEVKLLENLAGAELTKIIAAAYSLLYFPSYECFEAPPLQAMMCNIPVITSNTGSMFELYADAAFYMSFDDPAEIAEKLLLIFKDENLRGQLIEKGRQKAGEYSWDKSSGLLWQTLSKTGS